MMEKRSYPRIELSHTVLYSKDVYPRLTIGSALDLGMGGTRIESLYRLAKGDRLDITIGIESRAIKCRGRVIYVIERENGRMEAGVQFEELSAHDKLYLRQYLLHVMEQEALRDTSS